MKTKRPQRPKSGSKGRKGGERASCSRGLGELLTGQARGPTEEQAVRGPAGADGDAAALELVRAMNPLMQVTVVCEILWLNLKALTNLRDREMMARYTRNDVVLGSNLREYLSLVLADRGRMFGVADVRKPKSQKASQAV